jgi:hypothetical protein
MNVFQELRNIELLGAMRFAVAARDTPVSAFTIWDNRILIHDCVNFMVGRQGIAVV